MTLTVLFIYQHTPVKIYICSKMALEVGVLEEVSSQSHDDATPLPLQLQVTEVFFKSHNFFIMEKCPISEEFYVKVET